MNSQTIGIDSTTNNIPHGNYNSGSYGNYGGYGGTGMNGNMQQMMMMMIFPMMSTMFGTLFQSLISDLRTLLYKLFSYLYNHTSKLTNKYIFKKYDDINELHIPLFETTTSYDRVSETISAEGLPLVWYLNTKTMLEGNKLKVAKILEHVDGQQVSGRSPYNYTLDLGTPQPEKSNKKTMMFIPLLKNTNKDEVIDDKLKDKDDPLGGRPPAKSSLPKSTSSKMQNAVDIGDDIFIELTDNAVSSGTQMGTGKATIYMILKSEKKSLAQIGDFYMKIKCDYDKHHADKSGKLYIYNGMKAAQQFGCYDLDKSQTFDNIFIDNKQEIINDIMNLADVEYYKQYGMKRKIGHLYVGPPGSGKTCFVTAIAQMTGRSVVYIPISRIQSNAELQSIIYDRKFNNVTYNMDEIIFIADELDSLESEQKLKKNTKEDDLSKKKEEKNSSTIVINTGDSKKETTVNNTFSEFDKLNIGMFLNILDGNNNQDGMILIGTANDYEKLDKAIYRNGRMELIKFRYMGRHEIATMIEHYYKVKLSQEQLESIRDDRTVQSLNIKNVCLKHIQKKKQNTIQIDDLINEINYMFDHVDEVNITVDKKLYGDPISTSQSNVNQLNGLDMMKNIMGNMLRPKNEYINKELDLESVYEDDNDGNDDNVATIEENVITKKITVENHPTNQVTDENSTDTDVSNDDSNDNNSNNSNDSNSSNNSNNTNNSKSKSKIIKPRIKFSKNNKQIGYMKK